MNTPNQDRTFSLITGATSGIGLELARTFARHGHRVILVAPRADELHAIASDLEREFGDLHVRLVGHSNESVAREIKRRAHAAGKPWLVDLVGAVPPERMPDYLNRAHLFAAPSFHEFGPGSAHLGAMACGLPVVACTGSGVEAAVEDQRSGLLVPVGDHQALVGALRRLLLNHHERQSMGARARLEAVARGDTQVCLARLESFYESVVLRPVEQGQLNCA